jgi:hypothetical protein
VTRLSPHFTLEDFTWSDTASRAGINNTLPADLFPAAVETAAMLERIRTKLSTLKGTEVPMLVSSGYRCPALNWAVRYPLRASGADGTGDHPLMAAIDWRAPAFGTPYEICVALAPLVGELSIGQLIYEHTWVHTSRRLVANTTNRIITKVASGYAPGIVAA